MAKIDEIAPDVYRISITYKEIGLQFNHFLVKDDEPLLFHSGLNSMFDGLREGVSKIIKPESLRWVGFSHFESDECGSLNRWLEIAPRAEALCSELGAIVSVNDFAKRPAKGMKDGETLKTGSRTFRFCSTAHLPHGWDAGVLFEETGGTLFCSDLFTHFGEVEPLTESDVVGRAADSLRNMQSSPFAYYIPYTPQMNGIFGKLAALDTKTLAIMHGSSFTGDCGKALLDLSSVIEEILG
ncbi:MAG: MBL fold metallo-hydrolase [Candidatus Dadabacteria bacterium RIFCSPHIGHO2_12_FULL_53_21]|nr:MAG: MBL fold metallo-hydrolase [Candidatus Dadabacteria bacterium RIFCSPHIGHO2_12_FULL_53_21]